ncbi:MAG: hypothetical protein AUI36_33060, partial [Cyanobacteria bacterium 13_1_40CM_2_61_4]
KGPVKLQPVNLNNREIEADNLCQAIVNDLDCLVNFEFQSYADPTMPKRMWAYNALATFSYDLPTYSFAIYLRKCTVPEEFYEWAFPTSVVVHRFIYTVIKLWEIPVEVLKRTGLIGIFPLMVLGQDGKRPEVVEDVITTLEAVEENKGKELLSLTYIIASLVFESPTERRWLKRRFQVLQDALRDTWAYQEIMQEGWEEGLQKGIVEGRAEGRVEGRVEGRAEGRAEERLQRLKDQRELLMTLVQMHFPNLTELAQRQANAAEDPEALQQVVLKLVAAQTQEQAEQVLLAAIQDLTHKGSPKKQRKKRSV